MAKKTKQFIENFRLQKALDGYKASLALTDKLHMFNSLYKVIKSQDEGYTILEDEKNTRFAIPTPKLYLLMKKGICKNYGAINLEKGFLTRPPSYKPNAPGAAAAPSGEGPGRKGEPVGTVKVNSKGEQMKKVSDNPSKWVHVANGTMHTHPDSDPHEDLVHPEDQKALSDLRSGLLSKTKPEVHEKLNSLMMDWVGALQKHRNLLTAHNTNDVDDKGRKLPRTGIPRSTIEQVNSHKDKADRIKKQMIKLAVENRIKKG